MYLNRFLSLFLISSINCFNINLDEYISVLPPKIDRAVNPNFGYSISFHKKQLYVGSPNAFNNNGVVYNCAYTKFPAAQQHQGEFRCNSIRGLAARESQLLGATVRVNRKGTLMICAPGFTTKTSHHDKYITGALYNPGRCFYKKSDDGIRKMKTSSSKKRKRNLSHPKKPKSKRKSKLLLKRTKRQTIFSKNKFTILYSCPNYDQDSAFMGGGRSQCTSGIDGQVLPDDNILVSSPGADYWQGTVDFIQVPHYFDSNDNKADLYQGPTYSLASKKNLFDDIGYKMKSKLEQKYEADIRSRNATLGNSGKKHLSEEDIRQLVDDQVHGFLLANTWDNNLAGYTTQVFENKEKDNDQSYLIAIGAPKRFQFNLLGAVSFRKLYYDQISQKWRWVHDVFQVNGTQSGEGFGSSMITADIDKDGAEDILIGSPYFTKIRSPEENNYQGNQDCSECGRISYFRRINKDELGSKQQGAIKFELIKTLEGKQTFGRFGYSIVKLGNIDSFPGDEFAVSAPGSGNTAGAVFILSWNNLKKELVITQEISAKNMPNIQPENSQTNTKKFLSHFGQSLSPTQADLDENEYPDIAIGAQEKVLVYNTRPVVIDYVRAELITTDETNPQNLDTINLKHFQGINRSKSCQPTMNLFKNSNSGRATFADLEKEFGQCYKLKVCLSYKGRFLSSNLDLKVLVELDAEKPTYVAKRLKTPNFQTDLSLNFTNLKWDSEKCLETPINLLMDRGLLTDKMSPIIIKLKTEIIKPEPVYHVRKENYEKTPALARQKSYPILAPDYMEPRKKDLSIEISRNCGDDKKCHSNFNLLQAPISNDPLNQVIAGQKNQILKFSYKFKNILDAAYDFYVTFKHPSSFQFSQAVGKVWNPEISDSGKNGKTEFGELSVKKSSKKDSYSCESVDNENLKCFIANPVFSGDIFTIELSFNVVEFDDVESYEVVLGFLSTSVLGFGLIEWNNFRFYFCVMTLNF